MYRYIHAATDIQPDGKIQEGLEWVIDGHVLTVTELRPNGECIVEEKWIAEDSGRECKDSSTYRIGTEQVNGCLDEQYIFDPAYKDWKLYASGATNYPWDKVEEAENVDEYEDAQYDEDYIPSSTYGDYSPSNPWDAPGMRIHDFI
jgi:hypothetical protein